MKKPDPNQCELDFCAQVETLAHVTREILEHATAARDLENRDEMDTELELHVEIAAACKRAIRDSGLSRVQVLGLVNAYLGRTGGSDDEPERKRPISLNMFNNYLSSPCNNPLPTRIVHAIVKVTGNFAPYELVVEDAGGAVITTRERTELQLGKVTQLNKELTEVKRQLQRDLSRVGRI